MHKPSWLLHFESGIATLVQRASLRGLELSSSPANGAGGHDPTPRRQHGDAPPRLCNDPEQDSYVGTAWLRVDWPNVGHVICTHSFAHAHQLQLHPRLTIVYSVPPLAQVQLLHSCVQRQLAQGCFKAPLRCAALQARMR